MPETPFNSRLRIDFVSDVACPWCAVGLYSLREALQRIGPELEVDLHFQPFELNPQMAAEGEDATEHLVAKYGSTPQQMAQSREAIRARGAELGFTFNTRERVYNTFDAHRLLHWAGIEGGERQLAMKQALLRAYFSDGENISDRDVLVRITGANGLDEDKARTILESDQFVAEVRAQERFYLGRGINSVPSVIINERHLISGGQPVEVFERALRHIAAGNAE